MIYAKIKQAGAEDVIASYSGMSEEVVTAMLEEQGKTFTIINEAAHGVLCKARENKMKVIEDAREKRLAK